MRDKYANKTPVMRFFHKYTGFIFCAVFLSITIPLWLDYTSNMYFFENWDCGTINAYTLTSRDFGYTPHDELTDEEHVRLHEIFTECNGKFSDDSLLKHGG